MLVDPARQRRSADLVAFSRRFGPLEIHSRFDNTLPAHREVFCVGNVERDGMKASFSRGVEQWHADSSYREMPSDASLFYGEIVPPEGGDTMFADATAAYRTLDPALQRRIEGLRAVHALDTLRHWGARHNPDRAPDTLAQAEKFPPVSQPLVRVHPATGAKSLYVCPAVISHIEGMDDDEGAALIDELIAHVTQPRFVYSHQLAARRSGHVGQPRGAAHGQPVRPRAIPAPDVSHDHRRRRACSVLRVRAVRPHPRHDAARLPQPEIIRPSGLPANRWTWKCGTSCPRVLAHIGQQPIARRFQPQFPRDLPRPRGMNPAISASRRARAEIGEASSKAPFGITSTCVGAWGLMSWNASAHSSSIDFLAGDLAAQDAGKDVVGHHRAAGR